MSVVRINAITVPEGSSEELLRRFQHRVGEVDHMTGFEGFELLRPTSGDTWYVYTRWASEADFLNWVKSPTFARSHAEAGRQAVAHSAELLRFDIVLASSPTHRNGTRS